MGMVVSFAILLLIGPLIGCEEDVIAVLGTDRPYSLYGVISPQLDSQWVRVFPIEDRLEPDTTTRLGGQFVSTDLTTGEQHVWRDSVILDSFDQTAHVYWAPFTAEYGHAYELVVTHTNGAASKVTVDVPPLTEVVVQEPEISSIGVRIPVLIRGDAPRLLNVEVVYAVGFRPAGNETPTSDLVPIPYQEGLFETPEGWIIPIRLDNDFEAVVDTLIDRINNPIDRSFGVLLNSMTLRLIVANDEWNPPGGKFDVDVLVQPGALSNVENGFGFVGAGYRHAHRWNPDPAAARLAGFRAPTE